MKLLLAFVLLSAAPAFADTMSCELSESKSSNESLAEFSLDLATESHLEVTGSFGRGHLVYSSDQVSFKFQDSKNKPLQYQLSGRSGDYFRVQHSYSEGNDFLQLTCQREGSSQRTQRPVAAQCELKETAGSYSTTESFMVALAVSGHDFTVMPAAKLAPVNGWVLLYNGGAIAFMHNTQAGESLSLASSWDKPFAVSWYPSTQNIQLSLICNPVF